MNMGRLCEVENIEEWTHNRKREYNAHMERINSKQDYKNSER